jgi:hypothetical protein
MGTHTPGPWEFDTEWPNGVTSGSGTKLIDHFAVIKPNGGLFGRPAVIARLRCEENARLIAAAPDLLYALREIVAYKGPRMPDLSVARAARS